MLYRSVTYLVTFQQICGYVLEMVIDKSIVTMEDDIKSCALSNSAIHDDLE